MWPTFAFRSCSNRATTAVVDLKRLSVTQLYGWLSSSPTAVGFSNGRTALGQNGALLSQRRHTVSGAGRQRLGLRSGIAGKDGKGPRTNVKQATEREGGRAVAAGCAAAAVLSKWQAKTAASAVRLQPSGSRISPELFEISGESATPDGTQPARAAAAVTTAHDDVFNRSLTMRLNSPFSCTAVIMTRYFSYHKPTKGRSIASCVSYCFCYTLHRSIPLSAPSSFSVSIR